MAWPTDNITTTHLDQSTDDPSQARAELYNIAQKVKQILAEVPAGGTIINSSSQVTSRICFNPGGQAVITSQPNPKRILSGWIGGIDQNSNRVTVPNGFSKVQIFAGVRVRVDYFPSPGKIFLEILKNETAFDYSLVVDKEIAYVNNTNRFQILTIATPVIGVGPGDFFRVQASAKLYNGDDCSFQMPVENSPDINGYWFKNYFQVDLFK